MSDLPGSWATAAIRDIAYTSSGGTPSRGKPEYFGGSIPWVKSGELNDGFVRSTEETITEEGLKNSSAKIFPVGTVCIALYGATVGKTAVLAIDASTNQAVCGIQPKDGIRRNYLLYFLQSQRANLVRLSQGGAQPNISQELVRSTEVPLAPSPEQDRIVAEIEKQFTRLDAATTALKRVQANLKRYRASVLKAACEGRLVPTEAELARKEGRDYEPADQLLQRILRERRARWEADTLAKMIASGKPPTDDRWKQKYKEPSPADTSNLPELPEGWCWAAIDQLSWRVQYGSSARCGEEGEVPVLRMGNIQIDGSLSIKNDLKFLPASHMEFPELLLEPGDLLFNRTNSAELVGKSAVYNGTPHLCSFASYLIRVSFVAGCLPQYVSACLNSTLGKSWIKTVVNQQVGQANVNGSKLKAFAIPLPPDPEQSRITDKVIMALTYIDRGLSAAAVTETGQDELRQSILRHAFSGQLIPQDPTDEPAAALLDRIRADRAPKAKPPARPKREGLVHA